MLFGWNVNNPVFFIFSGSFVGSFHFYKFSLFLPFFFFFLQYHYVLTYSFINIAFTSILKKAMIRSM